MDWIEKGRKRCLLFKEHPNGTLLLTHTKGIMYLKPTSDRVSMLRFTQFMTAVLKY